MNANREAEIALIHFGEKPVIKVKEEKQLSRSGFNRQALGR